MKVRQGFVSNSSSCSFVVTINNKIKKEKKIKDPAKLFCDIVNIDDSNISFRFNSNESVYSFLKDVYEYYDTDFFGMLEKLSTDKDRELVLEAVHPDWYGEYQKVKNNNNKNEKSNVAYFHMCRDLAYTSFRSKKSILKKLEEYGFEVENFDSDA
mgnify:CR=1 FL=1